MVCLGTIKARRIDEGDDVLGGPLGLAGDDVGPLPPY
jgi:hypothetical protein